VEAPGEVPTKEWQKKIADYVFPTIEPGGYNDLTEWGVDEETGDALYDDYFPVVDSKAARRAAIKHVMRRRPRILPR